MRALLFASLAEGKSQIINPLISADSEAMKRALSQKGGVLDVGNSGISLRFLTAVKALCDEEITITGDTSIRTQRDLAPLQEGLTQFGVKVKTNGGFAPISVKGPFLGGEATIVGEDSQHVSALLIAMALRRGPSRLKVLRPGEKPFVKMTLNWFDRLKIPYFAKDDYSEYALEGGGKIAAFDYSVPTDWSQAAFPIAAALITGSTLIVKGLDREDCQGDKRVVEIFSYMGGDLSWQGEDLLVKPSDLRGIDVDVNDCIDLVPALAALACYAKGKTRITGASVARGKECNRLYCVAKELSKMGGCVVEIDDGLLIEGKELMGAKVSSHADHRMVMALTCAALGAKGKSVIEGVSAVKKTYPNFASEFVKIGASIS
jgi:3-phosphoshikimate 1-carboxyvinyltransferase